MNVLDENIPDSQRRLLRRWRIRTRQIGHEIGRKGLTDDEIRPFLLRLPNPTFFSRDRGFYGRGFRHPGYCLAVLNVPDEDFADYTRRFLRHLAFDAQAKRMGMVVRVSPTGITFWRLHRQQEERPGWT